MSFGGIPYRRANLLVRQVIILPYLLNAGTTRKLTYYHLDGNARPRDDRTSMEHLRANRNAWIDLSCQVCLLRGIYYRAPNRANAGTTNRWCAARMATRSPAHSAMVASGRSAAHRSQYGRLVRSNALSAV